MNLGDYKIDVKERIFFRSYKDGGDLLGTFLGMCFLVPYIVMLALGAFADHQHLPRLALGYFDVWLLNVIFGIARSYRPSKWYLGTEKRK